MQLLSKEISQTFQQASVAKKDELDKQLKRLKEPIEDYLMMVDAALDACIRRRKLVFRYYELRDQLAKNSQSEMEEP